MKNIKYLIALIAVMFIGVLKVQAYSTAISGASSIEPEQTFTVTIKVNGAVDLWGSMGSFSYDSSKLTLVSSSGSGGFTLTLGSKLVVDAASGANGSVSVATITFKATKSFAIGESTTITLGAQEGSNGSGADLSGTGSSLKINMAAPKSSNNYLSALSVDKGTLKFNKNTTSYSLVVDNNVSNININATGEDSKATIGGTGSKTLKVYSNTFNIVVTAENGTKKTYKVVVIRKDEDGNTAKLSNDNTLKSLTVEGYDIGFSTDKLTYELTVASNIESLNIEALAANNKSSVTLNNLDTLQPGENEITIEVKSETGEVNIYTIKVNKETEKESNNNQNDNIQEDSIDSKTENGYKIATFILSGIILVMITTTIILWKKKKIVFQK